MRSGRPLLLDLFCGAGGCAVGYHRAGFDVVGVDVAEQPRYPFPFHRGDAILTLRHLLDSGYVYPGGKPYRLEDFAAIHASPPCQRFSTGTRVWKGRAKAHPDLVGVVRYLLAAAGMPYVIENVEGAPLHTPALVCGLALGLGVKRHRLFESSTFLFSTTCPAGHRGDYINVFGHGAQEKVGGKGWVTVYGGGAPKLADRRRRASAELAKKAMGIDWMTRDELSQAIPPAYTEFIGKQLCRAIGEAA